MKEKNLFIKEVNSNEPELVQFWDDTGAYIDLQIKILLIGGRIT